MWRNGGSDSKWSQKLRYTKFWETLQADNPYPQQNFNTVWLILEYGPMFRFRGKTWKKVPGRPRRSIKMALTETGLAGVDGTHLGQDRDRPSPMRKWAFFLIYIWVSVHDKSIIYRVSQEEWTKFGRVFLMLKYTDITQNTYIQSWTVTEIMAREVWKHDKLLHTYWLPNSY